MTTRREIEADPYAHADADKLWKCLTPIRRVLQKLPAHVRKSEYGAAAARSGIISEESEATYFNFLSPLLSDNEIDCGEHPTKFIALQLRYPKLRKLYVQRRVAACLHNFYTNVMNGIEVGE